MIDGACFLGKPKRVALVVISNGLLKAPNKESCLWKSIDVL